MKLRQFFLALMLGTIGSVALPAAPASAGPYCGDIDVVWCAAIYVIEKADCKVNGNCQ